MEAGMAGASGELFHWDEFFRVNIGVIDMQHQKLVSMVNELHQAMVTGSGKDKLGAILSNLIKYTRDHFATEERLMQSHAYPDFLPHKSEHEHLCGMVVDFQRRFLSNEVGLTIEVMDFLKDWLRNHILGSDKRYSPFLNAKGVH
jgi:hemerythrin-like metal-binding protein